MRIIFFLSSVLKPLYLTGNSPVSLDTWFNSNPFVESLFISVREVICISSFSLLSIVKKSKIFLFNQLFRFIFIFLLGKLIFKILPFRSINRFMSPILEIILEYISLIET